MNKKLLFLGHTPPPNHGAAIVGEMVYSFLKKHYKVIFLRISVAKGVSDIGKKSIFYYFFKFLIFFTRLITSLLIVKPKVIYITPSLSGKAFYRDLLILIILYIYKWFISARVVCHLHMRPTYLVNRKMLNNLWNVLTRNVDVILLSKNLMKDFDLGFEPRKVFFLPNSVNRLALPQLLNRNKVVLYIGHIMESKGAFRLLSEIKNFGNDVSFLFAGEFGSKRDEESFTEIASNYPKGKVTYVGVVRGDEKKSNLFSKASLLAIPSYSEALPLTMIEAFSCGLPVVSTNVGGLSDYVNSNNGFLCKDFSLFTLGAKQVLENGREYYFSSCIETYDSFFTQESFRKNLTNIFEVFYE